ncbi:3-ketoacyl-ACP reductase [Pseudonocardia sulfidoxydans NBRC 16205]|uniref:3-ketoacyl-ACP reductase n=1 Tax=Pseudonocardia sulfidoxydans NBRC 16205 TaxID=1223511 RepID=A0A511DBN6_9PSEU|nr:SDR family oxidoreductase [Pseudonocardia sulfidoxydans]GEL22220.1 3-ketoacyl-ACP reductase [Pseudonocardia sulfidoxydans NBRC 16205]
MGRLDGKVALVTGAGRVPGRALAAQLVRDGAALILVDHDDDAPSGAVDLISTRAVVQALGGRVVVHDVDVVDKPLLTAAVSTSVRRFGGLDAVVVGPVVTAPCSVEATTDEAWCDALDRVLTGAWNVCRATLPHLVDGGSLTVVGTAAGLRGYAHLAHQAAAEHGVVGLVRSLAHELAPRSIRVNTVHPVADAGATPAGGLVGNLVFDPEAKVPPRFAEAGDVSETVAYLASDDARLLTGLTVPVTAGLVPR